MKFLFYTCLLLVALGAVYVILGGDVINEIYRMSDVLRGD